MKSQFQLLNYKVLNYQFESARNLDLSLNRVTDGIWNFDISIMEPSFIKSQNIYIAGVYLKGQLTSNQVDLIKFSSEIVGFFQVSEELESELAEKLVKVQGPALLLPFLRATVIGYFASSGFGAINIPLINIHKIAEDSLKEIKINVIE